MNTNVKESQAKTNETKAPVKTPQDYIKEHGGTKSSAIRAMLAGGMTRGQVAKALNIRYQHVRNVDITPIKKPAVATQ